MVIGIVGLGRVVLVAVATQVMVVCSASAGGTYDTGASDTEIKIGNTNAYSGPTSATSLIAKTEAAYFKKINEEGGIQGRKINFISNDDAYSPPKTVEQVRKLVEGDEVLFMFNPVGSAQNLAIRKYLNAKKVPQLFVGSASSRWDDPAHFPWTTGFAPSYHAEGVAYAKYILSTRPNGKIGVLYQNDELGRDYLKGLKDGLGQKASMIVAEEGYEVSEPTIETHVLKLKSSGADILLNFSLPKAAAQAIRKVGEIEWSPVHILANIARSITNTIRPAGFDKAQGIISSTYLKEMSEPRWKDDEGVRNYLAFLDKYMPGTNPDDAYVQYGYTAAQTMMQVLRQCGDTLTRENVIRQAASLENFGPDLLLPALKMKTSPTDFAPIEGLQLIQLRGEQWSEIGEVINIEER